MHDSANTQPCSINRLVQGGQVSLHQVGAYQPVPLAPSQEGSEWSDSRVPGRSIPNDALAESVSHYPGEFRDAAPQWVLLGKLYPALGRQNGMPFPEGASRGNRVPEFASGTGYGFPNRPAAETVSRNRHPGWGAFSRSTPCGKPHPASKGKTGAQFPGRASKRSCGGIVPV